MQLAILNLEVLKENLPKQIVNSRFHYSFREVFVRKGFGFIVNGDPVKENGKRVLIKVSE